MIAFSRKLFFGAVIALLGAALVSSSVQAQSSYGKSYSRSPGAEDFIGFFGGSFSAKDSDVTVTFTCGGCVTTPQTNALSFDSGSVMGLRSGLWGINGYDVFGVAIELSKTLASGPFIDVDYNQISVVPMMRIPLMTSSAMPGGHLNLYGGLAGHWIFSGNMAVRVPPAVGGTSLSGSITGNGYGAIAGVAVKFTHFTISGEYRHTTMHTKFANADGRGNADISGPQAVVTLGYVF